MRRLTSLPLTAVSFDSKGQKTCQSLVKYKVEEEIILMSKLINKHMLSFRANSAYNPMHQVSMLINVFHCHYCSSLLVCISRIVFVISVL